MKKIFFLLLPVLFLLDAGCKKPEGDDLSGQYSVKGSLYINDTLRGLAGEQLLPSNAVRIKYLEDSAGTNFLYSVNSTTQSGFEFTSLSARNYLMVSEKTLSGLHFSSKMPVAPASQATPVKMVLYPDYTSGNLLKITCRDFVSNGLLNNASVCLFYSRQLAQANQCTGSFFTDNSNSQGWVLNTASLPTGWIYINASLTAGAVNIQCKDSINITAANGLFQKAIYLK